MRRIAWGPASWGTEVTPLLPDVELPLARLFAEG